MVRAGGKPWVRMKLCEKARDERFSEMGGWFFASSGGLALSAMLRQRNGLARFASDRLKL